MESDDSHESTIARGASFVLVATVLSTGVGFLIRTFLIRELNPEAYGLFALALSVSGAVATVGALGLRQGVARTIPRCDSESEVRDVTLTALTSSLALSVLFSAVFIFFADPIATFVLREADLAPFLPVVGFLVPAMTIQYIAIATFRGKKRVQERIVVRNFVSPLARLALVVVVVTALGYGAFGAIAGWTTAIVISTLLALYYLYRRTNVLDVRPFTPQYRTLLAFSLPLMISSTTWMAVQQADNLLLGYYLTSFEVGIYDGAFLLARLLLLVLGSFGFLFMPIFSELEAAGERQRMHDVYNAVTEWAALLVLPLYLAALLVPETVLTSIFKGEYALGTASLMLVSSGFFVHVLSGLCGNALVALGRTRLVMVGNVGAGVLNIALNVVLIPEFGITGAAAASAVSYALFNLFYLFWLHRETGILPFSVHFLKPLVASTLVVAALWIVATAVGDLSLFPLVAVLAVTYVVHGIVVLRTKRMTPGDEQLLSKLEAKLDIDVTRLASYFR